MDYRSDKIFGEMEYHYCWQKKQKLVLWGREWELTIKAVAYTGEEITEAQRVSYQRFLRDLAPMSARALKLAADYAAVLDKAYASEKEIVNLLTPKTVLFQRDGGCGILCDFDLDVEHGLAISLVPKEEAGPQDIFL